MWWSAFSLFESVQQKKDKHEGEDPSGLPVPRSVSGHSVNPLTSLTPHPLQLQPLRLPLCHKRRLTALITFLTGLGRQSSSRRGICKELGSSCLGNCSRTQFLMAALHKAKQPWETARRWSWAFRPESQAFLSPFFLYSGDRPPRAVCEPCLFDVK